ncbi:putative MFS family arabinose efflux permease [Rhodothalassium salexigens DSM 2132]|uniref:Putative MFS family arabinose efflux permease n=1 Tax=Rhodothalassium salexigens DSM 2132 TaxID=1188247 RepID=A0A4R2PTT0_RHOSA|nr:hypothetical protein [Rhodothalassium salexigens DSM 2132]TCP38554.1 putative MFS family arabinose efflux permease [Rhodothalassium salexigens DSM 2132]
MTGRSDDHAAAPVTTSISPTVWLSSAGFVATAVSFGPARMGFGLFLPTFRDVFALSTTQAGLIASLGFLAFFAALPVTAWLDARAGQRVPVMIGAASAAFGFLVVATAATGAALGAGVALAGASAGFCWVPFNDAAERVVPVDARPGALSVVSTGTTVGVAAAGALFLGVAYGATDWRAAWTGFAVAGLAAAVIAGRGVPRGRAAEGAGDPIPVSGRPALLRRAVVPLYAAALCFGASNAVFLSFAADHVVARGGLVGVPDRAAAAVIFLSYGVCGIVGLATGWIEARLGLRRLLGLLFAAFAASLALIAWRPSAWGAVLLAAGLHGAAVMTISALLSFWSLRLFPGRGSLGFTAALVGVAAGSVGGPILAGSVADAAGLTWAFLGTAGLPLAAAAVFSAGAVGRRT